MKKIFITLLSIVFLCVLVALIAPFFISKEMIVSKIQEQTKALTGRELVLNGDMKISIWPTISISLNDVSFENASWAQKKEMVHLDNLTVKLETMPLLDREIKVKQFVLTRPVILLEKNKKGQGNWEIELSKKISGDSKDASEKTETSSTTASTEVSTDKFSIELGDIRIVDGQLTWIDHGLNQTDKLEHINVDIKLPTLDSDLDIAGNLLYLNEKIETTTHIGQLKKFLDGEFVQMKLAGQVAGTKLGFDGQASLKNNGHLIGNLDLDIPDIQKLVSWAQPKMTPLDLPVNYISLKSNADITADVLKFKSLIFKTKGMDLTGGAVIKLAGVRPHISGDFETSYLDLDQYIGAKDTERVKTANPRKRKSLKKNNDWDDTPIDMSALKTVDLNIILKSNGIKVSDLEFGSNTLDVKLDQGRLKLNISETNLFKGKISGNMNVDASSTPVIKLNFSAVGIDAKSAVLYVANTDKLSGTAESSISLTTRGISQKQMVGNLNGKGAVVFRNGAVEGIDLANIAQSLQNRMSGMEIGQGKTEFVEMGGNFVIKNGIVRNDDLKLIGPLVIAEGKGTVDLPHKSLNYRLIPTMSLTTSATQKNKETGEDEIVKTTSSLVIPVDIKGPFDNLKIRPDYGSLVTDILKDPKKLEQNAKQIKNQIKSLTKQLKGNKGDKKEAVDQLLKGFLGGF